MKKWLEKNMWIWPLFGSIIIWLITIIITGKFSLSLLFSSATLASFTLLLAFAQMIVITSGNGSIDLSTVYIFTLAAYISNSLMTVNILLGIVIAIIIGAIIGMINGSINIYLKVPAMITTLATGYITFTIVLVSAPFLNTLPNKSFVNFINMDFLGVSVLYLLCICLALLLWLLLYKSKYGKQLHAVGQNRIAAKYAGINVPAVVIKTFSLSGAISALGGIFCGAFIGGAFQDMGTSYFLPSVAATLIGGTSASGGKSSVIGALFGALMMSLLTALLNISHLPVGYQKFVQGAVLVLILIASISKKNN